MAGVHRVHVRGDGAINGRYKSGNSLQCPCGGQLARSLPCDLPKHCLLLKFERDRPSANQQSHVIPGL